MTEYVVRNKELGLSKEGVHLMRNGFNYETIRFHDIQQVEVTRGSAIKNRLVVLIVGVGLLGLGVYLVLKILDAFSPESTVDTIYIEGLLLPILPFFFGGYSIYLTIKKQTILKVYGKKNVKRSLAQFEKDGQLEHIKEFLKASTTLKQ